MDFRTCAAYALLVAFLAWLNLSLYKFADDDAYIHFRIAENLLRYGRPYFNIGEPLMASSSSGWTLILFLIFKVFGVNLKAVALMNALATGACVFVYARIIGELSDSDGYSCDLLAFAACVPALTYSSAGLMETPIAMLLLGAGMLLYLRGRPASFVLIAASVFFRLELSAVFTGVLAHSLIKRSLPPFKTSVYSLLGFAPFMLYNLYFFGTNIPHTVKAKEAVYALGPRFVLYFALPRIPYSGVAGGLVELVLMLSLTAVASYWAVRHDRGRKGILAVFAFSGLAVLAAYFAAGTMVFQWYLPIYSLPVLVSLAAAARMMRSVLFRLLAAVLLLPYAVGFAVTVYAASRDVSAYPFFESGARARKYLEVGGRLHDRYPDYTLMSSEIGGLGYGFKGFVYDACGLASEDALKYHPMKVPEERRNGVIGAIPPGYVAEARPDIIVSYDIHCRALLSSEVINGYVAVKEDVLTSEDALLSGKNRLWGSDKLNVFIRREKYSGAF